MSRVSRHRSRTAFCLAAALLAGAAARAGEPGGPARSVRPAGAGAQVEKANPAGPATTAGEAARAARVERHSPREGYPSLGPAGARNTLVFFTDYQ